MEDIVKLFNSFYQSINEKELNLAEADNYAKAIFEELLVRCLVNKNANDFLGPFLIRAACDFLLSKKRQERAKVLYADRSLNWLVRILMWLAYMWHTQIGVPRKEKELLRLYDLATKDKKLFSLCVQIGRAYRAIFSNPT